MNNSLCLTIIIILLSVFQIGNEKFETNKEYQFSHIEVVCDLFLKFEDVSALVPADAGVDSVKEFKAYVKENADTYSFERTTENGTEEVFIKNRVDSILFGSDNTAKLLVNGTTLQTEYAEMKLNFFSAIFSEAYALTDVEEAYNQFTFTNEKLYYSLSVTDGVRIYYIFE